MSAIPCIPHRATFRAPRLGGELPIVLNALRVFVWIGAGYEAS